MHVNINSKSDIENHKDYVLDYEHWMLNLKDLQVQQDIANNFQKAQCFDEIFTDTEIDWIYGYAFSRCKTVRHNDNGTIFISGNLQGIYEKFANRLTEILPGAENSPVVGGNFFITPDQYGLHNDSTRESDWTKSLEKTPRDSNKRKWVPWRNIIIPLYTAPKNIESHAVFFDQRHVDFAHVYNHGMKLQDIATTYPIVTDHLNIDFHLLNGLIQSKENNLKTYDKSHHEEYLYYTPHRRLTGLTPELTCEWKPKCPIVFDAVQLHATNKGRKDKQWTLKMGLLLTFLREVK
jgi:hypothetical protein